MLLSNASQDTKNFVKKTLNQPRLSFDEEQRLAYLAKSGDQKARDKIATKYLPLAIKVANKYLRYGIPQEDLINQGVVGLMTALDKFEPERGFRFSTMAKWWIESEIITLTIRKGLIHNIGSKQYKTVFFHLRKVQAKLEMYDDLTGSQVETLAKIFGCSKQIVTLVDQCFHFPTSLQKPVPGDNNDEITFENILVDEEALNPEEEVIEKEKSTIRSELLIDSLTCLNERERDIFQQRVLNDKPPTLIELGEKHGISRERVRQIQAIAFGKVKKHVLSQTRH